jgi:hypothetical protein
MSRRPGRGPQGEIPLPPRVPSSGPPLVQPGGVVISPPRAARRLQPPSVKVAHKQGRQQRFPPPAFNEPPPLAEGPPAPLGQLFDPFANIAILPEPLPLLSVRPPPERKAAPSFSRETSQGSLLNKMLIAAGEQLEPLPLPSIQSALERRPAQYSSLPLPAGVIEIHPPVVCNFPLALPTALEEVPPLPGVVLEEVRD